MLNLAPQPFERVVGLYIATLFIVWQISFIAFDPEPAGAGRRRDDRRRRAGRQLLEALRLTRERLIEIVDQVLRVLDPDRKAQ